MFYFDLLIQEKISYLQKYISQNDTPRHDVTGKQSTSQAVVVPVSEIAEASSAIIGDWHLVDDISDHLLLDKPVD